MVNPTSQKLSTPPNGESQHASARVLIVDRSTENREVLRTVLQRNGCEIFESDEAAEGLSLAEKCRAQLLIVDLDTVDPAGPDVLEGFDEQARSENGSVLLLGRISKSKDGIDLKNVVAKPYHYAPLIRKIEELLRQAEPACESRRVNQERS